MSQPAAELTAYAASMFSGRGTRLILQLLDSLVPTHATKDDARHRTGLRGEEDAYFYLRRRGYVMVAKNFRSPRHHGEIDLIGWDKDVLCFIEVKTRTTRDVKPAEAAVDREKRRVLKRMIRDYLRSLPRRQYPDLPAWRFDVISVYYDAPPHNSGKSSKTLKTRPVFELFQNAALSS